MFNRTFYFLQAKKIAWFTGMLALAAFTVMHAPLAPLTLLGVTAGIGLVHMLAFLPLAVAGMLIIMSPLVALASPIALSFNMAFLGIITHRIMSKDKMSEALKKTHPMGLAEKADLDLLEKLERKTNIRVGEKKICDVDDKKFSPNAAAVGGIVNHSIYIFSNLLKAPFTKKEKKAIFAHELGHIQHSDSLAHSASGFLYWTTCALAFFTFGLPAALLAVLATNFSYYAISQIDELLADQFSAEHANPKALMSGLDKLKMIGKQIKEREKGGLPLLDWPKEILSSLKHKVGMISHPTIEVRKSYLQAYHAEKQAAKCAVR